MITSAHAGLTIPLGTAAKNVQMPIKIKCVDFIVRLPIKIVFHNQYDPTERIMIRPHPPKASRHQSCSAKGAT